MTPRNDNVLVEMIEQKHPFLSIQDDGFKWRKGKVVAVGSKIGIGLKPGHLIMYKGYETPDIEENNKKFVLLQDEDVKLILE